jgi:hypothetical protein
LSMRSSKVAAQARFVIETTLGIGRSLSVQAEQVAFDAE